MFIPLADLDEMLPAIEANPSVDHVPVLLDTIKLLRDSREWVARLE